MPVVFLLCCTFTSLVQSAMGCMTAVQAYGFFGTIPATATTAAVSVAATKGLQLVFAVLLMVLGLIVAVNCLKEFFGKEAGSMPDEEPEWSEMGKAEYGRAAAADVSEADFADPLDRLSIYYCLSRPVAELFYAQFGEEAFPLAAAFYEKPKTTIRVNTLRTNDTALTALLQQEGHTVTPGPWPGALVVEFAGSPAASAAFKKGLFHVQGLASQFAALCVDAQPGQQVLDLCAAPGGKSLTLAEAMQDKGQLVSGEFVPARVPLLQQAFDRCGITCAVAVENDATQHNSDWPTFDRVLCDVPCSGLGVIAKKPDIRYKDLDGIENLLAAQQKILQNGADSLAENGRLVYSTCTVNDKENQAQVEKFLSANPDFHVVLPKTALPGADITPLGTLFLPHRTGTDGFLPPSWNLSLIHI